MESTTTIIEPLIILAEQLRVQRFSMSGQEKQTQQQVENFLSLMGYSFEREQRLTRQDIPDFLIDIPYGKIAIEVKLRYPKRQIYRQLERYAQHDDVKGIILLTGTSMGLPSEIHGKPCVLVSLGEGWM